MGRGESPHLGAGLHKQAVPGQLQGARRPRDSNAGGADYSRGGLQIAGFRWGLG